MITLTIPHDFDRWTLIARLRWWAAAYSQLSVPNRRIIADLEEAAAEVELAADDR